MTQHRAFENVRGPLTDFLARSLQQMTSHRPDWWRCYVLSALESGAPEAVSDLELQQLVHVFLKNSTKDRKFYRMFERFQCKPMLLDYLRALHGIRNKWAHENYVSLQEQYADLVICGRVVDELGALRGTLSEQDEQLIDAIKKPAATFLKTLTSDGEMDGSTSLSRDQGTVDKSIRDLSGALAELRSDVLKIGQTFAGLPRSADRPASNVAINGLADLAQQTALNTGALKGVASQLERTEGRINELITSNAEVAGRLGDLASFANTLRSVEHAVATTSQAIDNLYETLAVDDESDDSSSPKPSLTAEEVRDQLMALRGTIWEECGTGPSKSGLLRKRMIDLFISERIVDQRRFAQALPAAERSTIDRQEMRFLPQVFDIVSRMK